MSKFLLLIVFSLPCSVPAQYSYSQRKSINGQSLINQRYTSNPAVRVFNEKTYIYCTQDLDVGISPNKFGDHFAMRDLWVYTLGEINGKAKEIGQVLDIKQIPWGSRQLGASDITYHKGKYYLYFALKDKNDVFRIGVATADSVRGPFLAEKNPISRAYSSDPSVFQDDDGTFYLYFGGTQIGQLHQWENNVYRPNAEERVGEQYALLPRMARLSADMKQLAELVSEIKIVDTNGELLEAKNNKKRFGEATWVHKYNGQYYLSYSTGDRRLIAYAVGNSPYGPFTYRGVLMETTVGGGSRHSIANIKGSWYLFYHDAQTSGVPNLRNIYMKQIAHLPNGDIIPVPTGGK
ncbi:MAG: family 43 glycosylhydrolase [Sediminibacterium sp.]